MKHSFLDIFNDKQRADVGLNDKSLASIKSDIMITKSEPDRDASEVCVVNSFAHRGIRITLAAR